MFVCVNQGRLADTARAEDDKLVLAHGDVDLGKGAKKPSGRLATKKTGLPKAAARPIAGLKERKKEGRKERKKEDATAAAAVTTSTGKRQLIGKNSENT